jgi:hypothetical protein
MQFFGCEIFRAFYAVQEYNLLIKIGLHILDVLVFHRCFSEVDMPGWLMIDFIGNETSKEASLSIWSTIPFASVEFFSQASRIGLKTFMIIEAHLATAFYCCCFRCEQRLFSESHELAFKRDICCRL